MTYILAMVLFGQLWVFDSGLTDQDCIRALEQPHPDGVQCVREANI